MSFTTALLTNTAYGYPRGALRRIPASRLTCVHITANPNDPPATALQERNFANRAGSEGPSAHTYVDRDGSGIHAIDNGYAAWSNGALRSPKTAVPGVAEVIAIEGNPNEAYYREIETCGRYAAHPITPEQVESIAGLIAQDSIDTGIPISRATVHLHSDLDSEQRANCPVPAAQAEAWVGALIERAQVIHAALTETDMTLDELLALVSARFAAIVAERDAAVAALEAERTDRTTASKIVLGEVTDMRASLDLIEASVDG